MRPDAHSLVAAYAVDALEESERSDVEGHLDECDVCQEDLRGYRETLAALGDATAEPPPARLREAVMAQVRRTPQLPPPSSTDPDVDSAQAVRQVAPQVAAADADDPAPAPARGGSSGRALFALAASAVTAVAIGSVVWGATSADRLADVQAQQSAVEQVLAADDVVSSAGNPTLPDGVQGDSVVIWSSASQDAALLLPAGLPDAPDGRTWQAWTVTADQTTSAGVFEVAGGRAVALDGGVTGVDAIAVSLEPEGGSTAPTSDPVVVVPLA